MPKIQLRHHSNDIREMFSAATPSLCRQTLCLAHKGVYSTLGSQKGGLAQCDVLTVARAYHSSKVTYSNDSSEKPAQSSDSTGKSNERKEGEQKKKPSPPSKMLKRDEEVLAKLLDREGGSAGIATLGGSYEEGLGPESKKNMFRLI